MMNLKECGRNQSWSNVRYYHGMQLQGGKSLDQDLNLGLPEHRRSATPSPITFGS